MGFPHGTAASPCPPAQVPGGQQRPAGRWSQTEVGSWLEAHGAGLAGLAREHALTGRALLRLTEEGSLRRLGVTPRSRRRELQRELLRLRLQQEMQELRSIAGREHPPRDEGGQGLRPPRDGGARN